MRVLAAIVFVWIGCWSVAFGADRVQLPDGVSRLTTLDVTQPLTDLRPLDRMLRGGHLYALGESAHGSSGYTRMQLRVLRYLIVHRGVRTIFWEQSDSLLASRYVAACEGDLARALHYLDWRWKTEDVAALLEWLCAYNRANPDATVTLRGIDIYQPWVFARTLAAYAESAEDGSQPDTDRIRASCFGAKANDSIEWAFSPETAEWARTGTLPEPSHSDCMGALSVLENRWQKPITGISMARRRRALLAIEGLRAFQIKAYLMKADMRAGARPRDAFIAKNLYWEWRLDRRAHQHAAAYLAHNIHIARLGLSDVQSDFPLSGVKFAGAYFHELFGSSYKVIGLTGYQIGAMFGQTQPPSDDERSLDLQLHRADVRMAVVNPRVRWIKQGSPWLVHDDGIRRGRTDRVERNYDALIYLDESPASRAVRYP